MNLVALYLHQNSVFGARNGLQDEAGLDPVLQRCGNSSRVQPIHFKVLYQSHLEELRKKNNIIGG